MANAQVGPLVVKCPDDALAALKDASNAIERKHSLINPVQVDDVCLAKLRRAGNVDTHPGSVNLPEALAAESHMRQYAKALEELRQLVAHRTDKADACHVGALPVAHQELDLYIVCQAQGVCEAVCGNSTAAALFAGAYKQDFHLYASFPDHFLMRLRRAFRMWRKLP